jgi:hypothetical protein
MQKKIFPVKWKYLRADTARQAEDWTVAQRVFATNSSSPDSHTFLLQLQCDSAADDVCLILSNLRLGNWMLASPCGDSYTTSTNFSAAAKLLFLGRFPYRLWVMADFASGLKDAWPTNQARGSMLVFEEGISRQEQMTAMRLKIVPSVHSPHLSLSELGHSVANIFPSE